MKATPIPDAARQAVLARAGGQCERCGRFGPVELHHRRYRSRGGSHDVSNLVALCGWGNHSGCHGWAHANRHAGPEGWSLNSWQTPQDEAIWSGRFEAWFKLTDDGGVDRLP